MQIIRDKIEGPFIIDRDMRVNGMITVEATVEAGSTLYLHGMVNGTVRNEGGQVEIYGKADRVADTGSTRTHIDPKAAIG